MPTSRLSTALMHAWRAYNIADDAQADTNLVQL